MHFNLCEILHDYLQDEVQHKRREKQEGGILDEHKEMKLIYNCNADTKKEGLVTDQCYLL